MTVQETQFQKYLSLRRQSIYNAIRVQQLVHTIQQVIEAGGNPEEDPQLAPIYKWLVSEYGKQIFVLEQDENSAIEEES